VKHLNSDILKTALEPEVVAGPAVSVESFTGLSIDSRTIKPGEIFFAIVGDKNDGHDYIRGAFKQGAAAVVINRSRLVDFAETPPGLIFAVDDTHEALLNLAAYIRRRTDARFAAVTGSNGKTTTKEMFYSIARINHAAFRSPGNLNNLYGLPISLGMMPDEIEYAVFELGISTPGEMTRLAMVIKPELAIITNIGPAHLETLGTIENVVVAKFELIDNLPVGATIILNADDPLIMGEAKRRGIDFVGFGIENECRFRGKNIGMHKDRGLVFTVDNQQIAVPVIGRVNVYNALAAIAASNVWGCGQDEWARGLANFRPVDMRLEIEEYQGLHLMIDCYNANPDSVTSSLQSLNEFDVPGKKIAVLGDMLELGDASAEYHRQAGEEAARAGIEYLFCLGTEAQHIARGALSFGMDKKTVFHFTDHQQLLDRLVDILKRGDLVLCKGSRGMELEKIVIGLKGSAFKNN
jgi:UDP-N-acetylmuramoyl-tripeptide--D-alanyl-D-alanine ligase